MELCLKLAIICILSTALSLLVKKHTPEFAFLIALAAIIACFMVSIDFFKDLKSQIQEISAFIYFPTNAFQPLIKCLTVSVITQISCCICKDAGHSAVASALEFTGNIVVIICMLPLIGMLFDTIGGLL